MDRITATALKPPVFRQPQCGCDNDNCDYFYLRKFLFTDVKVRIVILSSLPTIFCNHISNGIYGLILFLKFNILKFL